MPAASGAGPAAGQFGAGTAARLQQGQGGGCAPLLRGAWLFLGKKRVVLVVSGCVARPAAVRFGAALTALLGRALAAGGAGQELGLGFSCARQFWEPSLRRELGEGAAPEPPQGGFSPHPQQPPSARCRCFGFWSRTGWGRSCPAPPPGRLLVVLGPLWPVSLDMERGLGSAAFGVWPWGVFRLGSGFVPCLGQ